MFLNSIFYLPLLTKQLTEEVSDGRQHSQSEKSETSHFGANQSHISHTGMLWVVITHQKVTIMDDLGPRIILLLISGFGIKVSSLLFLQEVFEEWFHAGSVQSAAGVPQQYHNRLRAPGNARDDDGLQDEGGSDEPMDSAYGRFRLSKMAAPFLMWSPRYTGPHPPHVSVHCHCKQQEKSQAATRVTP